MRVCVCECVCVCVCVCLNIYVYIVYACMFAPCLNAYINVRVLVGFSKQKSCFTAALLLFYCCFTDVLLLLYCCYIYMRIRVGFSKQRAPSVNIIHIYIYVDATERGDVSALFFFKYHTYIYV
jgi:hypothetical protein